MLVRIMCLLVILGATGELAAKKSGLAALRPRLDPTTLPQVPSACVDGRAGWREVRDKGHQALLAAVGAFPWGERHYRAPAACHRTLEILCAPDLDGDRTRDYLVRVRWRDDDGACTDSAPRHEAVLIAHRDPSWSVVDIVSHTSADGGALAEARVAFVQLPDGKIGLTCKTQTEKTGTGCKVLGFWVGAVIAGRLEKLGEADPELCTPD